MTQEKDSSHSSIDATADKTAASPKKTRQTARKPAARKSAASKPATEPAEQDAANVPAKKTRAAAKTATSKTTAANAAKSGSRTAKSAPKSADGKTPAGKPAKKTAATETPPASGPESSVAGAPKTDTPEAKAPKKTSGTSAAKAQPAQRRAAKAKSEPATPPSKDHAGTTTAIAEATPVEKPATEPAVEKGTPRETSVPEMTETVPPLEPQAETQTQAASPEGETKPASRRSRRGGRRRNKSRNNAKTAANGASTAAPDAESDTAQAEPAKDAAANDQDAGKSQKPAGRETLRAEQPPKGRRKQQQTGKGKPGAAAETEAEQPAKAAVKAADGKRKMFISVLSGELVEVVLAEEGTVAEYYVEMQHQAKVKGNIYKGVISNIDANLQAAFVSYAGGVKNGFLQIDEVHPEYYVAHPEPAKGRKDPPIQKVLKPGQEILVQVVKEPSGTKGAFLTSYLSLPGRFIVLTPGREQIGVSRKVENDEERSRLRGLLEGLKPGAGLGVIVRTASTGASKTSLQRDLQFLKRLWKEVRAKGQTVQAPGLIYEELDLSTRAVRDYLTDDVQEIWVDDAATAEQVKDLASLLFPKKQNLVQVHTDGVQSLFERFSLRKQLDQIHSREVSLPSGGRLVIDNTEALTAIDINSGRSSGKNNFEDMAYRTNLEAARAIPLQLRLRDIGGQVVADFIEMRDRDHWREVEKTIRNGMKGDRARYDVGKIGPFGMLEIVRQRLGSSAISISTEPCPCCRGTGIRRNMEWQAMQALREIGKLLRQAAANNQTSMTYQTETELALYLLNAKRSMLQNLEQESGVTLAVSMSTD